MSSRKKTSTIIISVIIVAGIALSITEQPSEKDSEILAEIKFDAVYLENDNTVQISFEDKSNNTRSVVLEILGMDVTYHETLTEKKPRGRPRNIKKRGRPRA